MPRGVEQFSAGDPYGLDALSRDELYARLDEVDEKIEDLTDVLGADHPKVRARHTERQAVQAKLESMPERAEAQVESETVEESSVEEDWNTQYGQELRELGERREDRAHIDSEIDVMQRAIRTNESRFMTRPELARQTNEGMRRRIADYEDQRRGIDDDIEALSVFEELQREPGEPDDEFELRRDIQAAKIDLYHTEQALHAPSDEVSQKRLENDARLLRQEIRDNENILADWRDQRLAA